LRSVACPKAHIGVTIILSSKQRLGCQRSILKEIQLIVVIMDQIKPVCNAVRTVLLPEIMRDRKAAD
jgi:hypothetical protein